MMSLCSSLVVFAAALSIPSLPPSEYADTEVVTNVALPAVRADSRMFSFRLELDATPSNNVSLVFGRDADGDGILSRSEEALLVGWDCGEWKVMDCATGEEMAEPGAPGRTALDWRLVLAPDLLPRTLGTSADGIPVFAALRSRPPRFLFNAGWNTAKVVCRGLDAPFPQIVCRMKNLPLLILVR